MLLLWLTAMLLLVRRACSRRWGGCDGRSAGGIVSSVFGLSLVDVGGYEVTTGGFRLSAGGLALHGSA